MSSIPAHIQPALGSAERRAHTRRRLAQLAYVGFGPDCGGVLLDISEGGLNCQIVGAFVEGGLCRLQFALPGLRSAIQADGQIVWSNNSRRGGGVRLLGLGEETRQQLQQWICGNIPPPSGSRSIPVPIQAKTPAPVPVLAGRSDSQPALTAVVSQNKALTSSSSGWSGHATVPARYATKVTDATPPHANSEAPLSVAASPQRKRAMGVAAVAACFILAAVLAFLRPDVASLAARFKAQAPPDAGIAGPAAVATPRPPTGLYDSSSQAQTLDQGNTPWLPSGDVGYAPPVAVHPVLPEIPAVKPAPATPNRPVQRQVAPVTNSRKPLTMRLPRPRKAKPAPLAAVRPEPPIPATLAPPMAFVDPQVATPNLPELPQPPRPQATRYQPPELLVRVEPVYSRFVREARLQGTVQVRAMIGRDGVPHSLSAVSGNARLAEMAFEAVRRWRYKPAMLNGQPIETQTIIAITFQLQ